MKSNKPAEKKPFLIVDLRFYNRLIAVCTVILMLNAIALSFLALNPPPQPISIQPDEQYAEAPAPTTPEMITVSQHDSLRQTDPSL